MHEVYISQFALIEDRNRTEKDLSSRFFRNPKIKMNKTIWLFVVVMLIGCAVARPQRRPQRPFGGGGFPGQSGFGGANAAGLGSGSIVGNQAIGTGTGIANARPGGFGIGLGVGGAIASPIGNVAFGQGESISVGK